MSKWGEMKNILSEKRKVFFGVALGVLLVGIVGAYLFLQKASSPFPDEIQKQLSFSVLYPNDDSGYGVDPKTISFIQRDKVLLFHVKNKNTDITLTQQATPDPFNDIPDYFTKVAEELHGYASFDSIHGKVALTHPEELKGKQSALFNGKGTLMFAHPSRNLSDDEWRSFFKSLQMQ